MILLDNDKLSKLKGGTTTLSSAMINAFVNVIKILYDAGHGVGSAIRRISEGNLCPLK